MREQSAGRRLVWLAVFGVAFGYLEGAVVVYLRALYYPNGFAFPLALPDPRVLAVEAGREGATLLMLLGVAMLAGRNAWERFGAFAFLFGVWDLVYYVMLRAALGWPASLMTWDVLFLLPVVWAGPVVSAALVAASLVAAGASLLVLGTRGRFPAPDRRTWIGAGLSLALLLWAFMANARILGGGAVPGGFPWIPYLAGLALGWGSFLRGVARGTRSRIVGSERDSTPVSPPRSFS
jgi:hypothetical protein